MNHPSIRQLAAGDVATMRRLNALFADAFDDAQSYPPDAPDTDALAQRLAKPHIIVLVAEAGEAVVGGLVAYELDKLERARSEIYLYDLAVAERFRRQGIATRLIERLKAVAQERGAWVVFVQADYGDDPAVALYTKLGVREDVMHFDIATDEKNR
jgi:aminoglycoside 3-N-acetyltransferase I